MKQANLTSHDILDLIPQRSPVVCVDALIEVTDTGAVSSLKIKEDFFFIKEGQVLATGLLENVAQTAAARAGYLAKMNNAEILPGFIISFKNVEVNDLPEIGDTVRTELIFKQQVLNMSIFTGFVYLRSKLVLSCEIRILLEEN